jgi:site-specific DNA-methyltransferase (adenine-specific)
VIADPALNQRYREHCQLLGLNASGLETNLALLSLRKQGLLRGLKSRRSTFPREDEYRFAAEIAARFLERREDTSLDNIICCPETANDFDHVASRISPGFAPVEYRWAALNLRKASRLKPELLGRILEEQSIDRFAVSLLRIEDVPPCQGLYIFHTANEILYVGEAENLNRRIRKHLDHSDNKGLARWIWEQGTDDLHLEIHSLPQSTTTRVRRAMELELIRSRNAVFNVSR